MKTYRSFLKNPETPAANFLITLALFLFFFLLYGSMAAPELDWGDGGETQLAAWTAGLSHPTGYPLFLMLGWLWTHLLALFGVVPTRAMTLFSVSAGAASVAAIMPMMQALFRRASLNLSTTWSLFIATSRVPQSPQSRRTSRRTCKVYTSASNACDQKGF